MNDENDKPEYGKTVVRDIFLVICLLIATSGIWTALWDIFKNDPTEGIKTVGVIIVTFFKVSWEWWATLGTIGVFYFVFYLFFRKISNVTDGIFSRIVLSQFLTNVIKLALVGLIGGWVYFMFS
ncbi:hypothetical protein QTO12_04185 [Vibrio owensii]|uniref:hypothetical protein n=1 Tax=Vibrio owensii TaxID=696485 RepID=UPI001B8410E3|nr:hypothetical protein [Vibrio parahaemolyticus]